MCANPQPTDSGTKVSNNILNEEILRDFSERQLQIIFLIKRVSWGCQKKYAVIPAYTKYFAGILGIQKQNIKRELDHLVSNKVIFWDKNLNIFMFNKDYDQWKIPYRKDCSRKLLNEIISSNLSNHIDYSVIENITQSYNCDYSVINPILPEQAGNIDGEQETAPLIDSIIDSSYSNTSKKEKITFGKFKNIFLTEEHIKELTDLYGVHLDEAIETLSSSIESKGYKYKNHYAVLGKHNWVYKKIFPNNQPTKDANAEVAEMLKRSKQS